MWKTFAFCKNELKDRGLIRTNNIMGERGEFLTIETYKAISTLPNLQAAPEGAKNVDALSRDVKRYSVKTITEPSRTTGVFYNCGTREESDVSQKFEYVVVVILDKNMELNKILEFS